MLTSLPTVKCRGNFPIAHRQRTMALSLMYIYIIFFKNIFIGSWLENIKGSDPPNNEDL